MSIKTKNKGVANRLPLSFTKNYLPANEVLPA